MVYSEHLGIADQRFQEVVMRAYNPSHIGPLVAGTKPNNKYESFRKRIDALVEGLRVGLLFGSLLLRLTNLHSRHRKLCVST